MTSKKTLSKQQCASLLNDYLQDTPLSYWVEDGPTREYLCGYIDDNPHLLRGKSATPAKTTLVELILKNKPFQRAVKELAQSIAYEFQEAVNDCAASAKEALEEEAEHDAREEARSNPAQTLSAEQKRLLADHFGIGLPAVKKAAKKTK
jgi:hypothetical protein